MFWGEINEATWLKKGVFKICTVTSSWRIYAVSKYDSSQNILETEHIEILSSYLVEQVKMILRELVCENEQLAALSAK